jgi:hypothetical protein
MSGMKKRTINAIISGKIKDWTTSIEDETVRKLVEKNTIVTGGCIASMLLGEDVNDYDVYFRNRETALAVANYYVARFKIRNKHGIECAIFVDDTKEDRVRVIVKSAGIASEEGTEKPYGYFETTNTETPDAGEYVKSVMSNPGSIQDAYEDLEEKAQEVEDGPKYRAIFMSTNAITLSHRIQIVMRFYGDPDSLHENYDYAHCTNYWTSWDKQVILRPEALEALLSKELKYVGSKYPVCSLFRLRKFIKRGWNITAGQILKIVMQINSLDLTSPAVLEEQLVGVDSAYFLEIIRKVKENSPEKIDSAYLIELIDRMF